jgi:hypothetical protein
MLATQCWLGSGVAPGARHAVALVPSRDTFPITSCRLGFLLSHILQQTPPTLLIVPPRTPHTNPRRQFSTGSIATLRDAPAEAGVDVAAEMRALWRRAYLAPATTVAVVGPQAPSDLEGFVREAFGAMDASRGGCGAEGGAGADGGQGSGRYGVLDVYGEEQRGALLRVAPMRDLRSLELSWFVPYGALAHPESKPWRAVGHALVGGAASGAADGGGLIHRVGRRGGRAAAGQRERRPARCASAPPSGDHPWRHAPGMHSQAPMIGDTNPFSFGMPPPLQGHESYGSAAHLLKRQGLIQVRGQAPAKPRPPPLAPWHIAQ